MIYIRIEIWPFGDKKKSRLLGEGIISNTGGDSSTGKYNVRLFKSGEYSASAVELCNCTEGKLPPTWKVGELTGFPRLRLGPWDLLYRGLKSLIGERNV